MSELLIFFAFPIATIIISIALQRIFKCPILIAAIAFAIFLIVTFTAFDETFLIATLAYTIIAFITAFIIKLISCHNDEDDLNLSNILSTSNCSCNNSNNNCSNMCGCRRRR